MLKFQEDYSRKGVVLFFLVLALGFYFRLSGLAAAGVTSQDLHSLFFAQNLDHIFFSTSESPFYFILCRFWIMLFPATILSLKVLSITLSLFFNLGASYLLAQQRSLQLGLFLFILWWLAPIDVVLSRSAQSGALFSSVGLLTFICYHYRKHLNPVPVGPRPVGPKLLWSVFCLFHLLSPWAVLVSGLFLLAEGFRKKVSGHELRFFITTSFPFFIYYGIRLLFIGHHFLQNLPQTSVGVIPLALLLILKTIPKWFKATVILALVVLSTLTFKLSQNKTDLGASVGLFKNYLKNLSPRKLVVCATAPELDYFFQLEFASCSTEVLKLHLQKQSFYLYSLDGGDELLIKFLTENTKLERSIMFNQSLFLSVSYPPKIP